MRTATPDTRRALAAAIGNGTPYAWAIANGVKPGTVYDCLSKTQPISARRENTIRALLGLPSIQWERREIEPARQKIVNIQGPRSYRTRQLRLTPQDAAELDHFVTTMGKRSFNQWWQSTRPLDTYSSELEATHTPRKGDNMSIDTLQQE